LTRDVHLLRLVAQMVRTFRIARMRLSSMEPRVGAGAPEDSIPATMLLSRSTLQARRRRLDLVESRGQPPDVALQRRIHGAMAIDAGVVTFGGPMLRWPPCGFPER
jgi:hypothetical protein